MKKASHCLLLLKVLFFSQLAKGNVACFALDERLESCHHTIKQTWDQKDGQGLVEREREAFVHVPQGSQDNNRTYPTLFIFHGKGGRGNTHLARFKKAFPKIANRFIVISLSGYQRSWNVVAEESRAPDVAFFEEMLHFVLQFSNVKRHATSLYGVSNGSGFVNNILIQSDSPHIIKAITEVSQLSIKQYHKQRFWKQGPRNQYREEKTPKKGRKILSFTGSLDRIIPSSGGVSRVPANYSHSKKLIFLSSENSILAWAKAMGHKGPKSHKQSYNRNIDYYSYLNDDVRHYEFKWDGHHILSPEMKILLGILLKMVYYRNDRRRHVPEEGVDASTLIGKQRYFRINRFEPLFC